jgi:TorA maturation chaperone TorD
LDDFACVWEHKKLQWQIRKSVVVVQESAHTAYYAEAGTKIPPAARLEKKAALRDWGRLGNLNQGAPVTAPKILEEDRLRAHCYRLLGRLLTATPDADALAVASALGGDETALGRGLNALATVATDVSLDALDDEFHALFLGVGRGELVPFGSFYLAGFLNEKPLAKLRHDMARLGIARAEGVVEPEDHICSLCEIMAGLILGEFGDPADAATQRAFFDAHLGSWAGRFFEDLETAPSAFFYAPVGAIGRAFMAIEATAFQMAA